MPRPIAARRQHEILARIDTARTVSVEELAEHFGVSRETVRRDLKSLAIRGRLDVVHGGALRRESGEAPFAERRRQNEAGKAAIGRLAAGLVEDGMVVILDSGTTMHAIAVAIAGSDVRDLTVCTTSLANAQILCRAGRRVTLLGGEIDPNDEATTGVDVIAALARFRVDVAFVGVGGITPAGEITDFSRVAAEQRRVMLASARASYFAADIEKFGRVGPFLVRPDRPVTGLIVDRAPPPSFGPALAAKGLRTMLSGAG